LIWSSSSTLAAAIAQPGFGSIAGQVVDQNGKPVAGVLVDVPHQAPLHTDANGRFALNNLAPRSRLPVSLKASGYVGTILIYEIAPGITASRKVALWPRAAPVRLDAVRGGTVPLLPAGEIAFPPNALVDERGHRIIGPVQVSATLLDVTSSAQLGAAPGDFTARLRDGAIRQIATFGILEVVIVTEDGAQAKLAPGQRALVKVPIPSVFQQNAPSRARSYSFELDKGRWIESGTVKLEPGKVRTADPQYSQYVGSLSQDLLISPWWATDPVVVNTTCMSFVTLEPTCNLTTGVCPPASGCSVTVNPVSSGTGASGYTNSDGRVCLIVQRGVPVTVSVYCDTDQGLPTLKLTSPITPATAAACTGSCNLCPTTYLQLQVVTGGG
jgi:hypothetical protein